VHERIYNYDRARDSTLRRPRDGHSPLSRGRPFTGKVFPTYKEQKSSKIKRREKKGREEKRGEEHTDRELIDGACEHAEFYFHPGDHRPLAGAYATSLIVRHCCEQIVCIF